MPTTYDKSVGMYRDAQGKAIAPATVRSYVAQAQQVAKDEMQALARKFTNGQISLEEWTTQFSGLIKTVHSAASQVGSGGALEMTPSRLGKLGARIKFQQEHLRQFWLAAEHGELSDAMIEYRAGMYGDSLISSYEGFRLDAMQEAGYTEVQNLAEGVNSCDECESIAAIGWMPIDELPSVPGERTCTVNCNCELEYRAGEDLALLGEGLAEGLAGAEEAGAGWEAAVADFEAEFPDIAVDLEGVDASLVPELRDSLANMRTRYPGYFGNIEYLGTQMNRVPQGVPGMSEVTWARNSSIAHTGPGTGAPGGVVTGPVYVGFNPVWFGSPQDLAFYLKDGAERGWWNPNGGTVPGVVTHEFGHVIEVGIERLLTQLPAEVRAEAKAVWMSFLEDGFPNYSRYAQTAIGEKFAEGFASGDKRILEWVRFWADLPGSVDLADAQAVRQAIAVEEARVSLIPKGQFK